MYCSATQCKGGWEASHKMPSGCNGHEDAKGLAYSPAIFPAQKPIFMHRWHLLLEQLQTYNGRGGGWFIWLAAAESLKRSLETFRCLQRLHVNLSNRYRPAYSRHPMSMDELSSSKWQCFIVVKLRLDWYN